VKIFGFLYSSIENIVQRVLKYKVNLISHELTLIDLTKNKIFTIKIENHILIKCF